jgi:hypothetical protein
MIPVLMKYWLKAASTPECLDRSSFFVRRTADVTLKSE